MRTPVEEPSHSGGLGLAIGRAIANAHQAEIEGRSAVGVGSEFRVRFPEANSSSMPITQEWRLAAASEPGQR